MIINSPAKGYTKSANLGLRESKSKFVVLMNSDIIVTPGWLEKMNSIFFLDSRIGMVGPLSNTASWQSIPKLFENNDWAKNSLPKEFSINKFSDLLTKYLFPVFPEVPFLNGFCMMIRKELLADIGYFDEEAFPVGYGEEDDFVLRARQAGWQIRWADNTYLFHAQSRSFTDKKRLELSSFGTKSLIAKHGESIISEGCEYLMNSPIIISIREHAKHILDREKLINLGKKLFKDKRILFVLPIAAPGGGANVIFDEALAMIRMGVDVRVFNLEIYRQETIKGYPNLKIPVTYGKVEDLQNLLPLYDAVIATSNISVVWIKDNFPKDENPIFGYYVQDFEPLFYNPLSEDYYKAYQSYILDPFLIRFTKTEWTRLQLLENIGVDSKNIGISVDTDLFRPIKKRNDNKIRIGAMIRTFTDYRSPRLTMQVLREISLKYADLVEIKLFGSDINDEKFKQLPWDFSWSMAGVLTRTQMVNFLNEVDIFCDFSTHQAMGLTSLEAMCCGCCVVVPQNGGSIEFINNGENGIVVDTTSENECFMSLCNLINSPHLIQEIKQKAIITANNYYIENSAFRILNVLFNNEKE